MNKPHLLPSSSSPFHQGEQFIQKKLGVRERMERFGQKVIRDHIPEQHRKFYEQLAYLLVGHVDANGWPWASILPGKPGFITSPDNTHLHIDAQTIRGDPLAESLHADLKLGLLGIDLNTRRRNRIAGHINQTTKNGLSIQIDQAFGNCPKYIQTRELSEHPLAYSSLSKKQSLQKLDAEALTLVANADTFFVSSFTANGSNEASEGVDISHRGGMPGFIHVDNAGTLTIPDYAGNLHFNTLGNFIENSKAGLLFIDFEKGHLLMLTGKVEVLFDSAETKNFIGAERLWTFKTDHGIWLKNALPMQWQLQGYSPFLPDEKPTQRINRA